MDESAKPSSPSSFPDLSDSDPDDLQPVRYTNLNLNQSMQNTGVKNESVQ